MDKIKLEDWRRLLRRKAYEEEEKALKEKCDVSKVEQVIFDYREVRSGHKRILPLLLYLQGWAPVNKLQNRIIMTNIRLKTLPLGNWVVAGNGQVVGIVLYVKRLRMEM